jgi:hypothetical protein
LYPPTCINHIHQYLNFGGEGHTKNLPSQTTSRDNNHLSHSEWALEVELSMQPLEVWCRS